MWNIEKVNALDFPVRVALVCQITANGALFMLKRTDSGGSFSRPWDNCSYSAQQIADYLNEYRVFPDDVKSQG